MPSSNASKEELLKRGLCTKCGEKPLATMYYCRECMDAKNDRARENARKREARG